MSEIKTVLLSILLFLILPAVSKAQIKHPTKGEHPHVLGKHPQ